MNLIEDPMIDYWQTMQREHRNVFPHGRCKICNKPNCRWVRLAIVNLSKAGVLPSRDADSARQSPLVGEPSGVA